MRSVWKCLLNVTFILYLLSMCSPITASAQQKPVEVWSGGDDGLTVRLRDALEDKIRHSSYFSLSSGKKPGTLIVTIPTNVEWQKTGKRMNVSYSVELSMVGHEEVRKMKGSCRADAISKCAAEIANWARLEVSKGVWK